MEAAVAEKEAGMTEWNDGRLDDLSKQVDRIETKMDAGFSRIDAKFDALYRILLNAAVAMVVGVLGLLGVVVGLVATRM